MKLDDGTRYYNYEEMISTNYGLDVNLTVGKQRRFRIDFDINFEKWDHNPCFRFNFTTPFFDFDILIYNIYHVDEEE